MGSSSGDVEVGFAKLQGEDFEYYMQAYSIVLSRNSKKSTVDVDLSSLGSRMNISRHHVCIFYDFQRRYFALEVLGKNGCLVEGVLHLPRNPPVKLDSQDLPQIGNTKITDENRLQSSHRASNLSLSFSFTLSLSLSKADRT
ncbi:Forkhead-associated (FHA) domain [Dillenia turbinata]|uniref:Forkhead-associated (FHA) domain n=1 Tax=Dillenia turbinata TaxID=194707 RepID=A0AAN8VLE7_9MAGN